MLGKGNTYVVGIRRGVSTFRVVRPWLVGWWVCTYLLVGILFIYVPAHVLIRV